jgi:hypothetical protein
VIRREIKNRNGEAIGLFSLGEAFENQGKITEAIKQIEQAKAIFEDIKSAHVKECDEALARLRAKA